MAYELLTGRLPFNDKRNLYNPALSAVLRSILTDKLDFKKPCWKEISPEGIDFVKCVHYLPKKPAQLSSHLVLCLPEQPNTALHEGTHSLAFPEHLLRDPFESIMT